MASYMGQLSSPSPGSNASPPQVRVLVSITELLKEGDLLFFPHRVGNVFPPVASRSICPRLARER